MSKSSSSTTTILICSALAFLLVFGMVMEVEGDDLCIKGPATIWDYCLDVTVCTAACVRKYSPTATGKCISPTNCFCYDIC
ncbi:hypothetical protein LINGRAHAP2_LOCUS16308 [Linum grandiflorum]